MDTKKGFIFSILAIICWSLTFILVKKGIEYSDTFVFTLFRLSLALPLMLFFRPKHSIFVLLLVTLVWNVGCFNFMGLAMQNGISASSASFLQQTNSLFYIILSFIFMKDKLSPNLFITIPIAFLGLWLFFSPSNILGNSFLGISFVLIGALLWGVGMVLLKKYKIEGSTADVVWLAGLSSIIQTPIVFIFSPVENIEFSLIGFVYGIGAFILTNLIANKLWMKAILLQKTSFLSHIILTMPIFVLFFDYIFLDNKINLEHVLGGALIILANAVRFIKIFRKEKKYA